jgi:hypothetical protein
VPVTAATRAASARAAVSSWARPFSKSLPIIASMSMKRQKALPTRSFSPRIAQCTRVPAPSGWKVRVVTLLEAKGSMNASSMRTSSPGFTSRSVILPMPTSLLPLHA